MNLTTNNPIERIENCFELDCISVLDNPIAGLMVESTNVSESIVRIYDAGDNMGFYWTDEVLRILQSDVDYGLDENSSSYIWTVLEPALI